ncbi:hypothetical protein IJC60_01800 [bacterium]|nr:hypothetical protein [bacterium]
MIINRVQPFKICINNKPLNKQNARILPQLPFDTVTFAGKKKQQLIGKYDQNKVIKRLIEKGAPRKSVNSILDNPKKKQALVKFIEDIEQEKIKFSRTPREREVILALDNEFSYDELQKIIDWQDNIKNEKAIFSRPLKTKEALAAIEAGADEAQIQRAIILSNQDEEGNHYLTYPITFKEGLYAASKGWDDEQADVFYTLRKNHIYAPDVVDNPKKYQKLIELTKSSTFKRPLSIIEAASVVDRNYTDKQIQRYIELKNKKNELENDEVGQKELTEQQIFTIVGNNLSDFQTDYYLKYGDKLGIFPIIANEKSLKRFLNLIGEFGEVQTSRALLYDEAKLIFDSKSEVEPERVQKYIDLIDKKMEPHKASRLVLKFWEYRNTNDINRLNNKEKRELLKKIMTESNSFYACRTNVKDFPLIPKNQEEYCEIVQKLANSLSNDIEKLTEKENKIFEDALNNLIEKISTINLEENSKEIKKELNDISVGISEIKDNKNAKRIIEKNLKILQKIANNEDFKRLSAKDKKILTLAALLFNINQPQGEKMQENEAAFDAFYAIQRLDLDEEEQIKIYEIIKNQNWQEDFREENLRKNPQISWYFEESSENIENRDDIVEGEIQKMAQDIAFKTRYSNTFELTKILSKALVENKGNNLDVFDKYSKEIEKYIEHIHKTQIFLPQTKFPKASQIKGGEVFKEKNIKNVVLDLTKCDFKLEKYGFEKGTTKDNLYMLLHGLDRVDQLSNFSTFSIIDTEALLSSSYINQANHKVFRQQGVILDVNSSDIHAGYYKDFGSGIKKTLERAKREYIFAENDGVFKRGECRTYIPSLIKQKLHLSDKQYIELIKKIQNLKSWTAIQKFNPKVANAMKSIFDEMELGKRKYGREYNEVLVSRPKIQAVFSYGQEYENIPIFLKEYAMKNDLPIILLGD